MGHIRHSRHGRSKIVAKRSIGNPFRLMLLATVFFLSVLFAFVIAKADPRPSAWEKWKTDFDKVDVELSEIISGGPPKDGIPAINDPAFISIDSADKFLTDRDPVIGLSIEGDARAYPLGVLMRHEIANDVVGGKAVTVTYCPLCNSAIVFDAMINGKPHDFGTTGRLRNSDLVMYDRQTETWWQQFSGRALIGDMIGTKLKVIPSRMESYADFKKRFPKGRVLTGVRSNLDSYNHNPYVGYDTSARPFLYRGEMPEGIDPMARVVMIQGENPVAVSLSAIRKTGKFSAEGFDFSWKEGLASALDTSKISEGREVGSTIVTRKVGDKQEDVAHEVTFAFVAHAFFPDVEIRK